MTERIALLIEIDKPRKVPDFSKIEELLKEGWKEMYQDISREDKRDFWRAILKEIRVHPDRHISFILNT